MNTLVCTMLLLAIFGGSASPEQTTGTLQAGPEAAIIQIARDYEAAYNKADAKAIGEMFAEDAEYTDEDGNVITGRDDMVKLLKEAYVKNPGSKLAIQVESVKSLTPDVAIERGTTLTTSKDGAEQSSAYTAVYVLNDGTWRIKQLIDTPIPNPAPGEMLSELAWMLGTWEERDGDAKIETTANWAGGGNYLTRNFKVTVGDDVAMQGWQIVGWDPVQKQIRSWMFDTEGGYQEGTWMRSGNSWNIKQAGYTPDGSTISSVSLLQRAGNDKCLWESTNRTLDGDPQPSLPRIEINRVK